MSNVSYTKPLTHKQLIAKLNKFAKENKMIVTESEGDACKVSSEIRVKDRSISIEIYDYKATNLYSDSLPTVAQFRKTKYEWHVQCVNSIVLKAFLNFINS